MIYLDSALHLKVSDMFLLLRTRLTLMFSVFFIRKTPFSRSSCLKTALLLHAATLTLDCSHMWKITPEIKTAYEARRFKSKQVTCLTVTWHVRWWSYDSLRETLQRPCCRAGVDNNKTTWDFLPRDPSAADTHTCEVSSTPLGLKFSSYFPANAPPTSFLLVP